MSVTLTDIRAAQERIAPYIVKTPMLRMKQLDDFLGCEVYVKAENMQVTGAFKLRGALNKSLSLGEEERKAGLVCASSGNHGRALAYTAKLLGTTAAVVIPDTAPPIKVEAIRALGAEVIRSDTETRFEVAEQVCREKHATLVPPFNDELIMAGQGTVGLEIAEQCPEAETVIVPVSGGGLLGGVSAALKAVKPSVKVYGAEPAALPRYSESLKAGRPVKVPKQKTIADALVSMIPGDKCFPVVQANVDAVVPVEDAFILRAMKKLLLDGKLLAEPSSCIGMGAVLQGLIPVRPDEKVCFLVSGGSVGLQQLAMLEDVTV